MNAARAALLAVFCALVAPCAVAQSPAYVAVAAPAATLAGEYHLDGVMETGSGLLLHEDGRFEWFFSYGALDLAARGRWTRVGDGIDLAVDEMQYPPQVPEYRFERMHLRMDGADLVPSWPWDLDAFRKGAERGAYTRE